MSGADPIGGGRLAATLATVLLALAGLGAPAAAAGPEPPPRLRAAIRHLPTPPTAALLQPSFSLGKHDGYSVEVLGEAGKVFVATYRNPWAFSVYAAPGIVKPGRIEADLGRFGRVSMRFRPSPERGWIKPGRRCRGKGRYVNRLGTFTGNVRFRGERGYVSARTRRAAGMVTAIAAKCLREATEPLDPFAPLATAAAREATPAGLLASWRDGVSSASFFARSRAADTLFLAEEATSSGRLAIFHYALRPGGPKRVRVNDAASFARVAPPPPFHGSAIYRAAPDGTVSWSGGLSVNFPGAPRTPLTGDPFEARLFAGI